jgi:glycosyltransferase involved in cell wall biosynthesis
MMLEQDGVGGGSGEREQLPPPPPPPNNNSHSLPPPQKQCRRRQYYRIAMVCDFFYPNVGGVENHIWALSQSLIRRGHHVVVITHNYGDRQGVRYLPGPLKVYYCPITTMVSNAVVPTFTATLPLLRSIFLRERIDIVHAHQATSTMGNEAVVYGGLLGLSTAYTDHSLFSLDDLAGVILNRVIQTTLCNVDAAICVSYTCRDNFVLRTRMKKTTDRVFVIPNAVDPTQFTPKLHDGDVTDDDDDRTTTTKDRYVEETLYICLVWMFLTTSKPKLNA